MSNKQQDMCVYQLKLKNTLEITRIIESMACTLKKDIFKVTLEIDSKTGRQK